ncbi:MAG: hypothetical protein U0641_05735 [Anaerolineae bacterium]
MTPTLTLITVFLLAVVIVLVFLLTGAEALLKQRETQQWLLERDKLKHEQKKDLAAMYFTSLLMSEEGASTFPILDDLLAALDEAVGDY